MIRHASALWAVPLVIAVMGCGDDPVVPLPAKFTTIQAGLLHTCGILEDGSTFCWGSNEHGQIGDGSRSTRTTPRRVLGDLRFTSLGLGGGHSCGITGTGEAYCWGLNASGQLGDGSRADRATPGPVIGGTTFNAISGGGAYNCGLSGTGQALCWGWNRFAQLGDGSTVDRSTPGAATGSQVFTSVATLAFHSCGLTAVGEVYCWGENDDGQLGTGDTEDRSTPTRVTTNVAFASVDVGYHHSCGVGTDNKVYCWGANNFGQLGLGPDAGGGAQTTPAEVPGGMRFATVSTGAVFTCGIEQLTAAAYCWGFNGSGQLGDQSGDTCSDVGGNLFACALAPQAVRGNLTFSLISANTQHVCGLSEAGDAYCWGLGSQGQLGNGTKGSTVFSYDPVRVLGQP